MAAPAATPPVAAEESPAPDFVSDDESVSSLEVESVGAVLLSLDEIVDVCSVDACVENGKVLDGDAGAVTVLSLFGALTLTYWDLAS